MDKITLTPESEPPTTSASPQIPFLLPSPHPPHRPNQTIFPPPTSPCQFIPKTNFLTPISPYHHTTHSQLTSSTNLALPTNSNYLSHPPPNPTLSLPPTLTAHPQKKNAVESRPPLPEHTTFPKPYSFDTTIIPHYIVTYGTTYFPHPTSYCATSSSHHHCHQIHHHAQPQPDSGRNHHRQNRQPPTAGFPFHRQNSGGTRPVKQHKQNHINSGHP